MISVTIPALFALAGILMMALAANPKVNKIGEIMFFCGLLVALFVVAHKPLSL